MPSYSLASAALRLALRGEKRGGARNANEGSTTTRRELDSSEWLYVRRSLSLRSTSGLRSRGLACDCFVGLLRSFFSTQRVWSFSFSSVACGGSVMFILWGSVLPLAVKNLPTELGRASGFDGNLERTQSESTQVQKLVYLIRC